MTRTEIANRPWYPLIAWPAARSGAMGGVGGLRLQGFYLERGFARRRAEDSSFGLVLPMVWMIWSAFS